MKKLGFDLDGVLYDWHNAVYTELVVHNDLKQGKESFWSEGYKTYKNNLWWDNIVQLRHLYATQAPVYGLVNMVNRLSKHFEIYYISNRPLPAHEVSKWWLTTYNFPNIDNLYLTNDKQFLVKQLGIQIFVEDREHNIEQLKNLCQVFAVMQPYNINYLNKIKTDNNIIILTSILGLERYL